MSVKIEAYGTTNRYIVSGSGFSSPKYTVSKGNAKSFYEEYNSIDTLKTAQNAAVTGITGTLSVLGTIKFAKKIPMIAKIPLALLAFLGVSMLAYIVNNGFAGKKFEESAQKYGAERVLENR